MPGSLRRRLTQVKALDARSFIIGPDDFIPERTMADQHVARDDVTRLLGDLDDHKVAEVIASGATMLELEEVAAFLARETDVMGDLEKPLTGRVRLIYEMIRRDEDAGEDDR